MACHSTHEFLIAIMTVQNSDCMLRFGYADFDAGRAAQTPPTQCPVKGCSAQLVPTSFGKTKDRPRLLPWCPAHGLRLHTGTFAYWNGPGRENEARLRNFIVRPKLVEAIALAAGMKAESHRLGYEMSEDAVSWNLFVSLAEAGRLREAVRYLTGRELHAEPELYLWGRPIKEGEWAVYAPLRAMHDRLEPDIHTFVTEPDIMLVAERQMIVCIEAKFGSGNPLAHDKEVNEGEKPVSRDGLVERYLRPGTERFVQADRIGTAPRSQLLRNVVFASGMANGGQWHVVNLVAASLAGKNTRDKSYDDPTPEITGYLQPAYGDCFTYRTWEGLYANCIFGDPALAGVADYLRSKSAHYRRAFELSSAATS